MPQPPPQPLGTVALEQPQGGLGLPCPGWPTWMGRGSVPASPQRAARGCPKSALLQSEPACPGAGAADGLRRSANGQGSPLLFLPVRPPLPPAAKGKRARARQWEPPGQRSRSLPCPALPCLQRGAERCGGTGRAGSRQLEPGLWLSGSGSQSPENTAAQRDSPAQPSPCPPPGREPQQREAPCPAESRPAAAAQRVSLLVRVTSVLPWGARPAG